MTSASAGTAGRISMLETSGVTGLIHAKPKAAARPQAALPIQITSTISSIEVSAIFLSSTILPLAMATTRWQETKT
jgi:hypothetical protein